MDQDALERISFMQDYDIWKGLDYYDRLNYQNFIYDIFELFNTVSRLVIDRWDPGNDPVALEEVLSEL